ncbi:MULTISPECIES: hypothetical protein [unclassified Microbacterium]|uniref:hypothetical protein n=1 Tax=unclassified Microbacterium TaxID=2609290 RepID=UPI000EA8D2BF|nr:MULTISPECIES: hypothetical protein [unclassified Microbacterium]MBT2484781.1 hypothetical protein [Microbacterium sp. ISL-108]RKN67657.1 hypothetical protein D7252_08715 [Microbacterium sp. CGR2]
MSGFTGVGYDPAGIVHKREFHFPPDLVQNVLRDIQKRIGEANAAKGFHEEGLKIRDQLDAVRSINRAGGLSEGPDGKPDPEENWEAILRNYQTARLALIVTEAAEAIEELRNGRRSDETWYSAKVNGDTYAWAAGEKPDVLDDAIGKPEGVPSEIADIVIRSFDFAHEAGFDLASIIFEKLAYNATRAHKHGRKF